jgi:hypothetical protein
LTFASFSKPQVGKAIDRLASADRLAVFVGAGISAEAGLPTWSEFVADLLSRGAERIKHFDSDEQRAAWVERTLRTEQPEAVAGIAQILLGKDLPPILREELYRNRSDGRRQRPSSFAPGTTARAVAALRVAWDAGEHRPRMKILTTNYDDLIEQALRDRDDVHETAVVPIYWPMRRPAAKPGQIKVHHLHGFQPRKGGPKGDIVLTDKSFYSPGESEVARRHEVSDILTHSTCLFLGTSFSDPNIIRYMAEAARLRRAAHGFSASKQLGPVHVAVFTQRSEDPPGAQRVQEQIAASRLEESLTEALFLDHYSDVGQFVFEVRNRLAESSYRNHHRRARDLIRALQRHVLFVGQPARYDRAQPELNKRLSTILRQGLKTVDSERGTDLCSEPIAAAVWLMDEAGTAITPWLTTDRIHRDPNLLQTVEVAPDSRWLAVRTVCEGRFMREPRDPQESRWAYLVGFPLLVDDGYEGLVPIGAITLSTTADAGRTALAGLDHEGRTLLREAIGGSIGDWLLQAARATGRV